ncbi:MAG: elongation factor Ts [Lachnospiraceae bacterium]|nr:elongation factor Ts [Lachnospiraceae bacterium]
MANITAAMVKELREMTGAGMMDCKKALNETDGNMEAAVDVLKKSGAAKAVKKAARIAAEGICRVAVEDNKKAVVVEVNSETDFVAKNEQFQTFVQDVADQALKSGLAGGVNGEDVETLLEQNGLKDTLVEKTATIGEKLSVRRFKKVEADAVVTYIHGGGRIGVIVGAKGVSCDDSIKEALTNIAMQVAAMNPEFIKRSDMSEEENVKLRETIIDSSLNDPATLPKPILAEVFDKAISGGKFSEEGKAVYEEKKNDKYLFNFLPKEDIEVLKGIALEGKASYIENKIFSGLVEGRISKQLKEICLMDQVYVKAEDGKQPVGKYLESVSKDLTISEFIRFEVGEGMEKKNEDFAAEVAAQLG